MITEKMIEAACLAHTPQFDRMDPEIQKYAREQMKSALSAAMAQAAPVAWSYEYHDFGNVWARHVILNNPDGSANPPTKHHGSEVRNVTPLYTTPPAPTDDGWQPMDSAPKDGTTLLLAHDEAVFSGWWYPYGVDTDDGNSGWVNGSTNSFDDLITYHPTHWIPLPAPPVKPEGE